MPTAKINGITINYEEYGDGFPLLIIPGITCDIGFFGDAPEKLSKHFRVVILDNRGVGLSDAPDCEYSIEMLADDAICLLDHLNIKKTHVLGSSMGGAIAQTLALKSGDYVEKLILSNTFPYFNEAASLAFEFFVGLFAKTKDYELLYRAMLPWCLSPEFLESNFEDVLKLCLENPNKQTEVGFRRQMEALVAFDLRGKLHRIKAKTHIIAAEKDIMCPLRESYALQEEIKGSTLSIIKGVGHSSRSEKPEKFVEEVEGFLL